MSKKPLLLAGAGGDPPKKAAPLDMVKALQARACKGDKRAASELMKLRSTIQGVMARQAEMIALLESPDPEPVIVGDDTEDIFAGGDELDNADHILRQMQGADTLTHKAALVRGQEVRQAEVAPWARINPVSVNRGTLGNEIVINIGDNPKDVVRWPGEDPETLPVTVTAAPTQQLNSSGGTGGIVNPFAVLRWGTRGMMVQAEVDIRRGVQLTVNASTMVVQVAMDTSPAAAAMKIAAEISFYPCVRTAPLTRTRFVEDTIGGGGKTVDIPPFAEQLWLWRTNSGTAFTIDVFDAVGTVVQTFTLAGGSFMFDPLELAPDGVGVTITPGGGGAYHARLIFGLTI